jgi:hypothetical protein
MNRTGGKSEVGLLASAQPALASITSLTAFRRDRTVDNLFVALFVVCLCVLSGMLAAKVSPLVAASIWNGF